MLSRLVAHESVDERPGCRVGDDTSEGSIEEIWVVIDRFLESSVSVVGQQLQVDTVTVLDSEVVEGLELLDLDLVVVATIKVNDDAMTMRRKLETLTIGKDLHEWEMHRPRTCCANH